jgi:phosphopantetheinyl transferase
MILLSSISSHSQGAENLIKNQATIADREHASKKKKADARHNSLLARALMRHLLTLGNHDPCAPILIAEGGKPYLKAGPHISLSHSKEMVAAAICADFPIGVDIEFHQQRDFNKLANYAFGVEEVKAAAKGAFEFYKIWTMREAIAKINGASIFTGMNGRDIDFKQYQVVIKSPHPQYSLAIAASYMSIPLENIVKTVEVQ